MKEFVIVLAGGKGERFWPVSRSRKPKQLLRLLSNNTMLIETINRTLDIVPIEYTFIVTGPELAKLISETHPEIPKENFIIEPQGKNTAPAIGLAAAEIIARYGDGILYVLASDHYIEPKSAFQSVLKSARDAVLKTDRLILMGIEPSRAETAYGYIHAGKKILELSDSDCYEVSSFKEKPNRVKAQEFYLSGEYLWNSGNFIMRAGKILEEANIYLPDFAQALYKYIEEFDKPDSNKIIEEAFETIPSISIDFAILEKTRNVGVIWSRFKWDDVGSWSAMERVLCSDNHNNIQIGNGEFLLQDTYETTILNDFDGLIVTYGISDMVIVRMNDVVLVMNKTRTQQIRDLIDILKSEGKYNKYL